MPLSAEEPLIDDRSYEDIVAEARTRIPRYAPEWTDLNDNEPGMAVVQLFGWMSELLMFRLGKVPANNYLKFLELIGIELKPAVPARTEITFPVTPTFAEPVVVVPAHTQVETDAPDDAGPIVFETERSLVALRAALDVVQAYTGGTYRDLSAANAEIGAGFEPFGPAAVDGNAVLFGFDAGLEFPAVHVDLMVWVASSGSKRSREPIYAASGTSVAPPAKLRWEYWAGKEWRTLDLLKDETAAFSRSGHLVFKAPAKGAFAPGVIGRAPQARYYVRAVLVASSYQRAPRLAAVRTNTVSALQAETIDAEILGGSNGRADQVFRLAYTPILDKTLSLIVDEGAGEQVWQEVPDFYASKPHDTHYMLNRTSGEIHFSDGRNARIPTANARRPANIIARQYRVGGGRRGMVPAGELTSLRGAVGGLDAAAVKNLFPAYGGSDEESLAAAKLRAPRALKSRDRAVTLEDFEDHAMAVAGIARAKAFALAHPRYPGIAVPGAVSVVVIPELDELAPMPTESTLRSVCAYLADRKLATVELFAAAPTYRNVVVRAELVCEDEADLAEVKQKAAATLIEYFHPLRGGDDGRGWRFGGTIYYSLLLLRLSLPGVKRVAGLQIQLDLEVVESCRDAIIGGVALLRSGEHELDAHYEEGA